LNLLHLLGTGDGSADGERNHSSSLYRFPQSAVQIDAGEPASRAFKALGLPYETVDRIILSHLHSDHIGGFFMLMQGYWLEQRRKQLVVHLPADGIEPIRTMLRAAYLFDDVLPFRLCFEALGAEHTIRTQDATITPFFTTHLESTRKRHQVKFPARYEAFCFAIETTSGLRIVHSADLGAPKDLAPLLDRPTDLLVCELSHFEPAQLFTFLQDKPIKRLLLTHLLSDYFQQREEIATLAKKMMPGMAVEVARDGGCVELE
jgi:ribonuclease BN (tRNA processing enzyme)